MRIADMEKKRKQRFAFLCIAFVLTASMVFAVVDYIENDRMEFVIDILVILFLIVGSIALIKSDDHLRLYRAGFAFLSLAFLFNTAIGAGGGTAVYWLFPFPLVFFFFFGRREGALIAALFLCLLCILLMNPFSFNTYEYGLPVSLRFIASFLLVTVLAYAPETSRESFGKLLTEEHEKLQQEKQNLQQAQGQIKTLSGLIPICCYCKKIRNDEGYWQQVEVYVRAHTRADFSHGICPDCVKTLSQEYKKPEAAYDEPEPGRCVAADRETTPLKWTRRSS